jgi:valyl-tRNA synthetase
MAGVGEVDLHDSPVAPRSLQVVLDETTFHAPIGELIDLGKEEARLAREIARSRADIETLTAKLANPSFIERAPPEIIEQQRERLDEGRSALARLEQALARLS